MKFRSKGKSGQILILVLLVVVVALAVGLSVASRNITNLKTSTQAEQSQRAFTAAEGGVEDVLSKLNTVANVMTQSAGTTVGNCQNVSSVQANCTLQNATSTNGVSGTVNVVASNSYTKTVDVGDVAQINLEMTPGNYYNGTFDVEWVSRNGDPTDVSLEFTFICSNNPSTTCVSANQKLTNQYGQYRVAYTNNTAISGQTGFTQCTLDTVASGYFCKTSFDFSAGSGVGNAKILRMKPFWNRTAIKVTPTGAQAANFPVQTYAITSVATTDTGVSRKVQVTRDALPQLPAVFDYVLYSGGDIIK